MYISTILIFGVIVCFLGCVIVFLVFYFWRVHNRSDLDIHPSVKMHQNVGEQRRKDPRADINWPVSMETSDGTIEAEVKNISLGGAFICCKKPLPLEEVFNLTIIGPDNEPVKATAKVVWSNINVPDEKVINRGMGVRFIKMTDRHIQLVRQIFQEVG
jgi:c-di-GMP-binding flagellar brake protein YcgR